METRQKIERRYDLDWVRVGAFGLLILYHVGMMYVSWGYHIKSSHQSLFLENVMLVLNQWRLPLLFLISGSAIYYIMKKVALGRFFWVRSIRLLIPLLFVMFLIVLPQVYYELKFKGYTDLTVLEFLKAYYTFDESYPTAIPTWNHLWFVAYLWVYSLLFIPALYFLKTPKGEKFAAYLTFDKTPGWMAIGIPVAVFSLYYAFIRPHFPSTHALTDDWFNHVFFFTIMIFGYMLAGSTKIWNWLKIHRKKIALAGLVTITIILTIINSPLVDWEEEWPKWLFYSTRLLLTLNLWLWILGILAYGFTYLNKPNKKLSYLNEAVYPFYILHQTIIIMIGYPLSQWAGLNIYGEGAVIIVGTFGLCFILYEYVIRRVGVLRFLFGMKSVQAIKSGLVTGSRKSKTLPGSKIFGSINS